MIIVIAMTRIAEQAILNRRVNGCWLGQPPDISFHLRFYDDEVTRFLAISPAFFSRRTMTAVPSSMNTITSLCNAMRDIFDVVCA